MPSIGQMVVLNTTIVAYHEAFSRIPVDSMHADCQIASSPIHFNIKSLVFKLDNTTGI